MNEGKYIYAIIETDEPREFTAPGIGGMGNRVYTTHSNGLAAVVSSSPMVKYPVSRDNTMAHQKVLEEVMKGFTVLPVRYCTIAEDEEKIKQKLLKARSREFKDLLAEMKGKVELGVRAFWTDMNAIFTETIEENPPIRQLKDLLVQETNIQRQYAGKIKIGQMVQKALEEKKKTEAQELLVALKPLSVDLRERKVYGDQNIFNTAFLVEKTKDREFDEKINELEKKLGQRTKLKYFGPIPPCNFVEVAVVW